VSEPVRVVICDDESERRDDWKEGLESLLGTAIEVDRLANLESPWRELLDRRAAARRKRESAATPVEFDELPREDPGNWDGPFDRADVLIVDYDLFGYEPESYLTGAIVAYVARCYSRCKVILGVNQYGRNPFDLTLRSDLTSFNDQSVGEAQIFNLGLWRGDPTAGFRPWSWIPVLDVVGSFDRRVATALENPTAGVLTTCGLEPVREHMPRSVLGMLERFGPEGEVTSLVDLARGQRLGYRANDEAASQESVARVAGARLAQWVESAVLPLQDVLIDVPHLVQRNPALLDEAPSPEALARTVDGGRGIAELGLADAVVEHVAATGDWLSRPALLWPSVHRDRELPGARNPREIPRLDEVFCEDLSRFVASQSARRFMSALDSTMPARWAADPASLPEVEGVEYRPLSRLAL